MRNPSETDNTTSKQRGNTHKKCVIIVVRIYMSQEDIRILDMTLIVFGGYQ